jgi:hypothetical protein
MADKPSLFNPLKYPCFHAAAVRQLCASVASQGGNSMAGKVGQIIARGDRRWLIRVYLGRDQVQCELHHRSLRATVK